MIRYVTGDATRPAAPAGTLPILLHVVNDRGAWGAGFTAALDLFGELPGRSYRRWWFAGGAQLGDVHAVSLGETLGLVHLLAQRGIGRGAQRVDYDALAQALAAVPSAVARAWPATACSFHMPRIGCGLGGGSWARVEPLIRATLGDADVTVYDLEGARWTP